MTLKISQLLHILLWLSLILFLLFHEYCNLNSKINKPTNPKNHHHHPFNNGRKVLLASKFDFSPFFNHHHRHKHPPPDPSDTEIDPRYGVEKRRVPTGPNPLHH
ncbi:hypothetical protein HN51_055975 [Arachis hypogaea]|uniref:CLAVATA3/ESR (CLE)-related protein n=1 Tax=Arachis hypogaea TaxID=3818 RepID=A0A444XSA9_ARAHY|nr:CLAVATA3/ESR (CLE)-related protein 12 [Arachis ipaensis]XP_025676729.1 CLAVATA3/ESR (CLE)-related protein 12 [Arachis hypogaea]QHN78759.1 CLAVATA3/ESR (CLE)-related protein [Arachis hypogaea]RYQ92582.1 hypothetical protein Ahy_B09g098807 [Arachis hypogaea]